jgi:hypothetical protein
MESLKIILACIAAAAFYGIVHDQFTARICIEYVTVFHPPVFATQSPTLFSRIIHVTRLPKNGGVGSPSRFVGRILRMRILL